MSCKGLLTSTTISPIILHMTEKLVNSFGDVLVNAPLVEDRNIVEHKKLSREQRLKFLGIVTLKLVSAGINLDSIIFAGATGVEMTISGAGQGNPAETAAGFAVITTCTLIAKLPIRAMEKGYLAWEMFYSSSPQKIINKVG